MNKEGNIMAVVTYVKVLDDRGNTLEVEDLDGLNGRFQVIGKPLIDNMLSADEFTETKKVSRTEMAGVLSSSYNTPFTVMFTKKGGESRSLRGRLLKPEPLMGRVNVEDLDVREGSPLRLVDNRTIEQLIVKGVRYILK